MKGSILNGNVLYLTTNMHKGSVYADDYATVFNALMVKKRWLKTTPIYRINKNKLSFPIKRKGLNKAPACLLFLHRDNIKQFTKSIYFYKELLYNGL